GEHEDGDVRVLLDQLDDRLRPVALTDHHFRLGPCNLAHALSGAADGKFGLFARLGAHDVLNAEPMLEILVGDDVKQGHDPAGPFRPFGGIEDRPVAFRGFVYDDQELAAMAFLEALADRYHGRMLPSVTGADKRPDAPRRVGRRYRMKRERSMLRASSPML